MPFSSYSSRPSSSLISSLALYAQLHPQTRTHSHDHFIPPRAPCLQTAYSTLHVFLPMWLLPYDLLPLRNRRSNRLHLILLLQYQVLNRTDKLFSVRQSCCATTGSHHLQLFAMHDKSSFSNQVCPWRPQCFTSWLPFSRSYLPLQTISKFFAHQNKAARACFSYTCFGQPLVTDATVRELFLYTRNWWPLQFSLASPLLTSTLLEVYESHRIQCHGSESQTFCTSSSLPAISPIPSHRQPPWRTASGTMSNTINKVLKIF